MDGTDEQQSAPQPDPYAVDKEQMQMALEALKSRTPVHEADRKEFLDAVLNTGLIYSGPL